MRHAFYITLTSLMICTCALAAPVTLPSTMYKTTRAADAALITGNYTAPNINVTVSGSTFGAAFRGYFTSETLSSVGDTLSFSFDFVTNDYMSTASNSFGFGLFNTASPTLADADRSTYGTYTGYQVETQMNFNRVYIGEHSGNGFGDTTNLDTSVTGTQPANNGTTQMEIRLERTASGVLIGYYQNGSLRSSIEDTASANYTFNTIGFGLGDWGAGTDFSVNNMSITNSAAIPEPAHYSLMAGTCFLVLSMVIRRRKQAAFVAS